MKWPVCVALRAEIAMVLAAVVVVDTLVDGGVQRPGTETDPIGVAPATTWFTFSENSQVPTLQLTIGVQLPPPSSTYQAVASPL